MGNWCKLSFKCIHNDCCFNYECKEKRLPPVIIKSEGIMCDKVFEEGGTISEFQLLVDRAIDKDNENMV